MLSDFETEQALLANLLEYGFESYHDITNIGLNDQSFSDNSHKIFFKAFKHLFEQKDSKRLDIPLVISTIKSLGYDGWVDENTKDYLQELKETNTHKESVGEFAKKLRKLEFGKKIKKALEELDQEVSEISGEESTTELFGLVESKLSNLAGFITDSSNDPVDIGQSIRDHLENRAVNPIDQMGIPTGFGIFDKCIGGGLRRHAITIIAARPKVGKSTLCKNMAYNIAKLGIPVLYLDTEMQAEDQMDRLISSVSGVELNDIETGKFATNYIDREKIKEAVEEIERANFKYHNISGLSTDAQLSIAKKWIVKDVGLNNVGKAKECVLVYDYIKLMDMGDLSKAQEYQALGFLVTALQNFAVKYDIPILTAAQLNRDGISVEDTSAIAGSDRLAMYCSSISILKYKTIEELEQEEYQWGNQKLFPLITRYGGGMESGDFINISFSKPTNRMEEKGTRANSQGNKIPNKRPRKQEEAPLDNGEQITF